jgi:hypothetical protein
MAEDERTPEELIAEAFNGCFSKFDIRIEGGDVAIGHRRSLLQSGWRTAFRVLPDDDEGVGPDARVESLEAISEGLAYNPKFPGSKEASERKYLSRNRDRSGRRCEAPVLVTSVGGRDLPRGARAAGVGRRRLDGDPHAHGH